ncbi:hypothetical protein AK830_g3269 [Neonectria ditissima]|uniref:C2H2-type domain-containing protein n=1 Tax=Neonectria ditissima TaxID=78410 RepID=A0A0P7BPI7_9HYPO|nr:hypothetical protein AK830_g3269 [Neonectria ditissima]
MDEPGPPAARQTVKAIVACALRSDEAMDGIKSPHLLHQEQLDILNEEADRYGTLLTSSPNREAYKATLQSIMEIGVQIKDLKSNHAATVERDAEAYTEALDAHVGALLDSIIDIVGIEVTALRIKRRQSDLFPSTPAVKTFPASSTDQATQTDAQASKGSMGEVDNPSMRHPGQTTSQTDSEIPDTTVPETANTAAPSDFQIPHADLPQAEDSVEQLDLEMPDATIQSEARVPRRGVQEAGDFVAPKSKDTTSTVPKPNNARKLPMPKRSYNRRKPLELSSRRARKRARRAQSHPFQVLRTIDFEEVFQNGNAEIKHTIVHFQDEWYIIKCDEHGLTFEDNPMHAAAKHLSGAEHNHMTKEHYLAIRHLGVKVLNCSEELAEQNNEVTLEALRRGYKPVTSTAEAKRLKRHTVHDLLPVQSELEEEFYCEKEETVTISRDDRMARKEFEGITNPTAGDIYRGVHYSSNFWYAVLVLPGVATDKDVDIGVSATIQDLGLTESLPPCCDFDVKTGVLTWKKDYEDGGPSINQRQFPVMYFDGVEFPSKHSVGWVKAKDLRTVDVRGSSFQLVTNFKLVLKFLNNRAAKRAEAELCESLGSTNKTTTTPMDTEMIDGGGTQKTDGGVQAEPGQHATSELPQSAIAHSESHAGNKNAADGSTQPGQGHDARPELPQSDMAHSKPPLVTQDATDGVAQSTRGQSEHTGLLRSETAQKCTPEPDNQNVAEGTSADARLLSDELLIPHGLPTSDELDNLSYDLIPSNEEVGAYDKEYSWFFGLDQVKPDPDFAVKKQQPITEASSAPALDEPKLKYIPKQSPVFNQRSRPIDVVSISSDSGSGSDSDSDGDMTSRDVFEPPAQPPATSNNPTVNSPPDALVRPQEQSEVLNNTGMARMDKRTETEKSSGATQMSRQPVNNAGPTNVSQPTTNAARPLDITQPTGDIQPSHPTQHITGTRPDNTAGPPDATQTANTSRPVNTSQPTTSNASQSRHTDMNKPQPRDERPFYEPPPVSNRQVLGFQPTHPQEGPRLAYYEHLATRPPPLQAPNSHSPHPRVVALPSPQELNSGQKRVQPPPLNPEPPATNNSQPSPEAVPSSMPSSVPPVTNNSQPSPKLVPSSMPSSAPPTFSQSPRPNHVSTLISSPSLNQSPRPGHAPAQMVHNGYPNSGSGGAQNRASQEENIPVHTGVSQSQQHRSPQEGQAQPSPIPNPADFYRCPHCSKEYVYEAWRTRHIRTWHKNL